MADAASVSLGNAMRSVIAREVAAAVAAERKALVDSSIEMHISRSASTVVIETRLLQQKTGFDLVDAIATARKAVQPRAREAVPLPPLPPDAVEICPTCRVPDCGRAEPEDLS